MKYFHPKRIFRYIKDKVHDFFFYYLIPDSWEIKHSFKKRLGYKCDLTSPKTFNEKIQWLKLHDRKEIYKNLVDKCNVKSIIGDLIGIEYIIPTIGVWNDFRQIDFSKLPEQFVLKCTHDSASIVICEDKLLFDLNLAQQKLTEALTQDYYHFIGKQWVYKSIKPRIIAEKFLKDDKFDSLADYKLYCFGGIARLVYVTINRFTNMSVSMYDMEWNKMPFECIHSDKGEKIPKPVNLLLMKELAEKIAHFIDNPFVRVDFYEVEAKVYFGEITFYPEGGMGWFSPQEWDYTLGSWIDLSRVNK